MSNHLPLPSNGRGLGSRELEQLWANFNRQHDMLTGLVELKRDAMLRQGELADLGMGVVVAIKQRQNFYETLVPDASELLNLIASTAAMNIASFQQLGGSR